MCVSACIFMCERVCVCVCVCVRVCVCVCIVRPPQEMGLGGVVIWGWREKKF